MFSKPAERAARKAATPSAAVCVRVRNSRSPSSSGRASASASGYGVTGASAKRPECVSWTSSGVFGLAAR